MNKWKPIKTCHVEDFVKVDLWFDVWASPLSMGIADAWRAIDCWRQGGHWYDAGGLLAEKYITHWLPSPGPPRRAPGARIRYNPARPTIPHILLDADDLVEIIPDYETGGIVPEGIPADPRLVRAIFGDAVADSMTPPA